MIFKNFEKTDRRIVGIALALLLLTMTSLIYDDWIYRLVNDDLGKLEAIGAIKNLKNDVRRRHQIAFTWLPLKPEAEVYQGDSIFTGDGSAVVITTKTGEELTIAANSLVVVKTREDSITLDIGFGSVEGKVGKGKTLRITSKDNLTELAGDDATIKVDAGGGDKLVLNVLAGEVKVRSPEGVKTLRRNDSAEIEGGAISEPIGAGVRILAPLADQRFRYSPLAPVEFKWQTPRRYNRMKIKIGTDAEFSRPLVDVRVNDNSYVAYNLPPDVPLYWQVIADGAISQVSRFYLVGTNPPVPIFPKVGQHFYFDATLVGPQAGVSTRLQWDGGSPALRYEVQLADNPQFERPKIFKSREKFVETGLLAAGDYYWRVKSLDYPDTRFSEVGTFKVGPEPTKRLAVPLADASFNEFQIRTKQHGQPAEQVHRLKNQAARRLMENFPELQWSAVAGADKYDLQISRSKDFRNLIVNTTLTTPRYVWRRPELGRFYWRVRARGELYLDGTYSPAKELNVVMAPPLSLSQTSIIDEVPDAALLDATPPPLELKWNPTLFTHSYQVQFSSQPDFKDSLEFLTQNSSRKVQISKRGTYFWRIRSLDAMKNPVSPWSRGYAIEFQRVFKDPALSQNLLALHPRQQDSLIIVGSKESSILFQWTKPYPDAEYTLEISYDIDFNNVAYRKTAKDNKYLFKEPLLSSVVYWRVRARKGNEVTPWTGANRFLVSYETTPFDFDTSEKMFQARVRARERQSELLAAMRRRLAKLRTPAGMVEVQLDTPQITFPYTAMTIESNLDPRLTQNQLNKMSLEELFPFVKNYPLFTWEKVTAAERYFIEIARDPEFKKVVVHAPTFNPYFMWDTVRPGQYYWRVQAFNDRFTRSNYSDVRSFRVEVTAPVPTSSDAVVEIFDEPREMWPPPAPFTLTWTPVVFARHYDVEFSEDATFKYSKVFRTPTNSHEFMVPRHGLYFWRVRPLNENKVAIGPWSPTRSVEVAQTQRGPATTRELTGLFPKDRTMIFVGEGLFNMLFYFTAPSSGRFMVEISDSPDFRRVLAQQPAKGDHVRIRGDFPEGKLYWRVRDNAKLRQPTSSDGAVMSPVYEFILRKELEPYRRTGR